MSIAEFARIPFVDEIVDAHRLSQRLGFTAEPTRIRVKPGHGALLSWRRRLRGEDRSASVPTSADWGWTAVVTDPNKLDNIRRRAERHGAPVRLHAAGEARAVLVSGRLPSDPKLVKVIARSDSGYSPDAEVLGYNPGRRLLLRSGNRFVRISSDDNDHLVHTARQWLRWGIPTLPVEFLGRRHTSVHSPWWGTGDLERSPDARIAAALGETIADLHHQEPGHASRSDRPSTSEEPAAGDCTLAELVPDLAADLHWIVDELGPRLDDGPGEYRCPLHGDLSPDQVLVDGDEFRIIDLERAGAGPAGVDVGNWVARCRMNGFAEMEAAFLDAYTRRRGNGLDVEAWCARSLLAAAIEPFRQCRPDWRARTAGLVAAAKEALRR